MALEEENKVDTPLKTTAPSPKQDDNIIISQTSSCQPVQQAAAAAANNISPPTKVQTPTDFIRSVAQNLSTQPVHNADPNVWGVLTAISTNARKRTQGMHILLSKDEHRIGRTVNDARFRIESNAVSGTHCKISRVKVVAENGDQPSSPCFSVLLKDTSTNGTFLNWEKLKKKSPATQIQHGDIVSFAAAPQHDLAFAFVYREVIYSTTLTDGANLKRKAEDFGSQSKRLKGIGIGAPDGPISLDDVRSLQRSNMELRKQLESHVLTIEEMRDSHRAAVASHETEIKELKESISQSYLDDIKDLRHKLEVKQKELAEISIVSAERQQAIEDLNERLGASIQSRTDAAEVINSQKATISELETQLDEERNQRREEQEKAVADQKAALQRAHSEAQEELTRQSDMASRREREFKEVINKLQESDKENRLLAETLRTKLEGARESLVISEKKVRQLEAQVQEEQQASVNGRKKVESLEVEMKNLKTELEHEKVAQEEAWAKVSALELEMAAAIRDLAAEKQRFQDARDRIILRETQLRTFYATTEEISALFKKQQEQLKAMQKTLEDEDNYENMSAGTDLIAIKGITNGAMREKEKTHRNDNNTQENSAASTPGVKRILLDDSTSDEASATEKHDCDMKSQEEGHHPQDIECTSADPSVKGAFGSDIDGVGTAPILDEDQNETEPVLGTESPMNFDLNKSNTLGGDTMQLDDEAQQQDNGEQTLRLSSDENANCSQSNPHGILKAMEDTEGADTIRTSDLLTSEVAGSWAINTDPSAHGENEYPEARARDSAGSDNDKADIAQGCLSNCKAQGCLSDCKAAAGNQIVSTIVDVAASNMSRERQAVTQMIELVEPNFFDGNDTGKSRDNKDDDNQVPNSESDTEEGSDCEGDDNGIDGKGESVSDTQAASDDNEADPMDESDVNSDQEDSVR